MVEPRQIDLFAAPGPPPQAPALTEAFANLPADLPDRDARIRIQTDLDASLLVEAGAGAGKTTEMVNRMVALIRTGRASVDQIAAVTFTRKAASELRERFQTGLEDELAKAVELEDPERFARIDRALREIDRAYIGTIHSFCARLLRDRALEVGLDPDFHETFAVEQHRLRREFYTTHVERLAAAGDPSLGELARVGLRPDQLRRLFEELTEHADVEFPATPVERPVPGPARAALEQLLDDAAVIMPAEEPERGWDDLQRMIRRLRFHREIVGWQDDLRFLHALSESLAAPPRATYRRWGGPGAAAVVRDLEARFAAYAGPDGPGGRLLRQWWAHRYPLALAFAQRAAREFERERLRTGALSFQDLLLRAAQLLRDSEAARIELGERFRFLLVDEFQDTDPIQAEVLLLLASEPRPEESAAPDWRRAVPRAGALFVVGDPKQSIYRFRRADMSIYNQVKRRFENFGAVIELIANFRSGPAIEDFVNRVFRNRFPPAATEHQAAFAPMRVVTRDGARQRVGWYAVPKPSPRPRREDVAAIDARRVASWIEACVREGQREPGDFLVLTRDRRHLMVYARAIEARNLPVQVTGAGVSLETELAGLRLLLAALADPDDPTLTLAVLTGLFFGLDFEQIAEHVLDRRGRLDFVRPPPQRETDVERALASLHELWKLARAEPADVLVAHIIDRFGLLPWAAAGELGESRAGALLYVLETVRTAALQGDASLRGALTAIEAALTAEEAEAPLEPGRRDVIRVMNLHQAKGLEAAVVILAAPIGEWNPPPTLHVTRPVEGRAQGSIVVAEKRWRYNDTVLACPLDWDAHCAAEQAFVDAERDRLLYVAATRAREELIIARYDDEDQSPWAPFYAWLEAGAEQLEFAERPEPQRSRLEVPPEGIVAETQRVDAARRALAAPTYRASPVTGRVKPLEAEATAPAGPDARYDPPSADGQRWGKLVHLMLERAGRGVPEAGLRAYCRTLLRDNDLPADLAADETTVELLVGEVRRVAKSDVWQEAMRADERLVEVPFALALPAEEWVKLAGPAAGTEPRPVEIVEGVIDLAFRDERGWSLVDYKTDREGAALDDARRARYQAQVDLYAACWTRITGQRVHRRMLLFIADGSAMTW